jgi:hypothetical protein
MADEESGQKYDPRSKKSRAKVTDNKTRNGDVSSERFTTCPPSLREGSVSANNRRHGSKSKSQERKNAECERPQRKCGQIIM